MSKRIAWVAAAIVSVPVMFAAACGDGTVENGSTGTGDGGLFSQGGGEVTVGAGGDTGSGGSTGHYSSGVGGPPTEIATCEGHTYECGDLEDNDNDGLTDYQDPDCLGPCDNTEDSYYGGIPGQNQSPCRMDCYFDEDSGHGDDDCFWNHKCDPNSVSPNYYPEPQNGALCAYDPNAMTPGTMASCDQLQQTQSQLCLDFCGPLTPNGCDCFGCCELPAGSNQFVWLGSIGEDGTSVCTADAIDDPTVCHPCLPVGACFNDCDPCEYCLGKTELPPECDPDDQCPEEWDPCGGPNQPQCASGTYCISGCCVPTPQ